MPNSQDDCDWDDDIDGKILLEETENENYLDQNLQ